jgi:hypothetical protein
MILLPMILLIVLFFLKKKQIEIKITENTKDQQFLSIPDD